MPIAGTLEKGFNPHAREKTTFCFLVYDKGSAPNLLSPEVPFRKSISIVGQRLTIGINIRIINALGLLRSCSLFIISIIDIYRLKAQITKNKRMKVDDVSSGDKITIKAIAIK